MGTLFGRSLVLAPRPTSGDSTSGADARDDARPKRRPAISAWAPAALLGAGILVGMALWAKWGFAVAFEAIRTYCF
jgi:hypothetical protein